MKAVNTDPLSIALKEKSSSYLTASFHTTLGPDILELIEIILKEKDQQVQLVYRKKKEKLKRRLSTPVDEWSSDSDW